MTPTEIESWVRRIVEDVLEGRPVEDSRVELKSEWIDAEKAAPRVAGHANAAQSEQILWIIGLDENHGVRGAQRKEMANWIAQLQARFEDGFAPSVQDLNVSYDNMTLVALLFSTDRPPYIVKNALGACSNQAVWVPWREGTRIRAARRRDLLRMLVPLTEAPTFDILSGELTVNQGSVTLRANAYLAPASDRIVIFPAHRASATLGLEESSSVELQTKDINFPATGYLGEEITTARSGRIVADITFSGLTLLPTLNLTVRLILRPITPLARAVTLVMVFGPVEPGEGPLIFKRYKLLPESSYSTAAGNS